MILDPKIIESLASIKVLYVDIDHTIHPYCNDKYGMQFFNTWIEAAKELSACARGLSDDELMHMAYQSFKKDGVIFTKYARQLDDCDAAMIEAIFKRSHELMIERVLPDYFKSDFNAVRAQKLATQFATLRELGIELIATTHGSEDYGQYVLGYNEEKGDGYNISHHFNHIVGLDSFGNFQNWKTKGFVPTKRRQIYHIDTIERTARLIPQGYHSLSEYGIIDDSASNMEAPLNRLGMVTVQPNAKVSVNGYGDNGHIQTPDLVDILDVMIDVIQPKFIGPRQKDVYAPHV